MKLDEDEKLPSDLAPIDRLPAKVLSDIDVSAICFPSTNKRMLLPAYETAKVCHPTVAATLELKSLLNPETYQFPPKTNKYN